VTEPHTDVRQILERGVFIRGADRPFGDLTLEDVRGRADELRGVTGWGPTVRVMPVAHAWRELSMAMEHGGCARVRDLPAEGLTELAEKLWVTLPGGSLMS
jgi:hypothetical protein